MQEDAFVLFLKPSSKKISCVSLNLASQFVRVKCHSQVANKKGGLNGLVTNRPWTNLVNPTIPERILAKEGDLDEGKKVYKAVPGSMTFGPPPAFTPEFSVPCGALQV